MNSLLKLFISAGIGFFFLSCASAPRQTAVKAPTESHLASPRTLIGFGDGPGMRNPSTILSMEPTLRCDGGIEFQDPWYESFIQMNEFDARKGYTGILDAGGVNDRFACAPYSSNGSNNIESIYTICYNHDRNGQKPAFKIQWRTGRQGEPQATLTKLEKGPSNLLRLRRPANCRIKSFGAEITGS